jgi:Fur family transcriptional regulator, ferric uptake regulator
MCHQCDYEALFEAANLEVTAKRRWVLEIVGNNRSPLSAGDIYKILERSIRINRVTVYRILDLLVDHGLVDRISTGGRAFYYGLAPNAHHRPHPHFYCKSCGQMDCLSPENLMVDTTGFRRTFAGRIDKVEVRIDGICKNCEKNKDLS